jgi:hypothetical protein
MNIEVKIVADGIEKCYNIKWPSDLRIENCSNVSEILVNNFKITNINSICYKDNNDIVIKFTEPNPMRWMLKLKNKYFFKRANIQ